MKRVVTVAAALAVVGCAAQLQIAGPYASQLSQSDIHQITALITPNRDVSHIYTRLEAIGPDKVRVKTGGFAKSHGVWTSDSAADIFTAVKRSGRWVATGEAEVERTITVY
jgi:hypothetical protein